MLYAYQCLYEKVPRLDEPLHGEDYSDMLQLVKDLCRTMDMLKEVEVKEAKRESQKSAATTMPETKEKRRQQESAYSENETTERHRPQRKER